MSREAPISTEAIDIIRRRVLSGEGMIYIAFVILIIVFSVSSPFFLTLSNFENIGRQTALVSIIAVGMTFVIVSGEFDLSVGSVLALAGVTSAIAMRLFADHWFMGALIGIATGGLVGFVNGLLTVQFRTPSFLITLGSLGIARGFAMMLTDTRPIVITNEPYFKIFGEGHVLGVPVVIAWTAVLMVAGGILLHFSTFGRKVFATGGNITAARYSGISTYRIRIATLTLTGLLAGFAGVVLSARSHAARPDVGAGLELDVITAVILGGAALSGGRGTIAGALVGSLIIGIVNNGLVLVGVDSSLQIAIKGFIIWIAVTARRQ
ncbi:MAG: ABC transporter permease [Rhodospirillales bacterium]|nr:ABC transporter permease [Rhodospirillales bacterium]